MNERLAGRLLMVLFAVASSILGAYILKNVRNPTEEEMKAYTAKLKAEHNSEMMNAAKDHRSVSDGPSTLGKQLTSSIGLYTDLAFTKYKKQ